MDPARYCLTVIIMVPSSSQPANPEKIRQYAASAAGSVSSANQAAARKAEWETERRPESDRVMRLL